MAVAEPSRPEQRPGERSAFLTEVAVGRARAPSRLLKVDENGAAEDTRPVEKTPTPHPPSPPGGRRASGATGGRRRTIVNPTDGHSSTSGAAKPAGVRSIRSLIQKAAQKTILVVRTKNAMQAAESVTIRFNPARPTDLPRTVHLPQIIDKVLDHATTRIPASSKPGTAASPLFKARRHVHEFREAFQSSPEVEALLKDLFWFSTSRLFQPGQHAQLEDRFFARIADSFTALFVRLQMPPAPQHQLNQQHQSVHARDKQTHAAGRFLDVLPDIAAQVLFASLYEAFPKSRESLVNQNAQLALRRICLSWLGGNGSSLDGDGEDNDPASYAHWLPVGQESPKRIAALADFPAMRNRMIRAERIERTKLATRHRHAAAVAMATSSAPGFGSPDHPGHPRYRHHHHHQYGANDVAGPDELLPPGTDGRDAVGHGKQSPRRLSKPPSSMSSSKREFTGVLPSASDQGDEFGVRVETRERCAFEMQNSPLVASFLDRHTIGAAAGRLRVQLRLTSSSSSHARPSSSSSAGDDGKESSRPSTTPDASSPMEYKAVRLAPHAPRERRRRVADPAGFMLALTQIQRQGDAVRSANAMATQTSREGDALDRQRLAAAHRALDGEFGALRQRGARLHEFSNQLVSKKRIDAMLGASAGAVAVGTSGGSSVAPSARAASGPVGGGSRPPLTPRASRGPA